MPLKGEFKSFNKREQAFIEKHINPSLSLNELKKMMEKKFNKKIKSSDIYNYVRSRKLDYKRNKRTKTFNHFISKALTSSCRDIKLKKGHFYKVTKLKRDGEEFLDLWSEVDRSCLEFLYSTPNLLVFKHKEGFIETFLKHNGIYKITEVDPPGGKENGI